MQQSQRSKYSLSVDAVVFGYEKNELKVALIKRKNYPFKDQWAIPGGFVEGNETVEDAASRELEEETGLKDIYLEQFYVFSKPDRDPRGRIITVAFFALINSEDIKLVATQDASNAEWFSAYNMPNLAFDHNQIYQKALESLRISVNVKPIIFELLPKKFTLTELQKLYEQIFNIELEKRNFRRKILKTGFITETNAITRGAQHRPAKLYQFNQNLYLESQSKVIY